jgi:hypothetical protein
MKGRFAARQRAELEKKPKVEASGNGALQQAKLKLNRFAAQRNFVEAERRMRLA